MKTGEVANRASSCPKVLVIQHSAAPKRFFPSLLENSVRNSQVRAMENHNEASLTVQYNKLQGKILCFFCEDNGAQ